MKWITPLDWELPAKNKINYNSQILTLGSCFSNNLGNDFIAHGFNCVVNPFGILFNPISIANVLSLNTVNWKGSRVVSRDNRFVSLDAHSDINEHTKQVLIEKLQNKTNKMHDRLKTCTDLFITLGAAWVYKKDGETVANCHKQDATLFSKELLSTDEMIESLCNSILTVLNINPTINLYISVSPIRHIKNGLVNDGRSKARLLEVAHCVSEKIENCIYLPANELLLDVLRDYRFYKADLIHPNEQAVEYILDFFKERFFTANTAELSTIHHKIKMYENHRSIIDKSSLNPKLKDLLKKRDLLLANEAPLSA